MMEAAENGTRDDVRSRGAVVRDDDGIEALTTNTSDEALAHGVNQLSGVFTTQTSARSAARSKLAPNLLS